MPDLRPYRVLITGGRHWDAVDLARRVVASLATRHAAVGLIIVHGNASGVDTAFADACRELGVPDERHPADWAGLGNRAGPIRNQEMVDAGADVCLAFHQDLAGSKGTKGCVRLAMKAGIPTWVVAGDGIKPRLLTEIP